MVWVMVWLVAFDVEWLAVGSIRAGADHGWRTTARSATIVAMTAIDLDNLVAIDVHTHAEVSEVTGCGALSPELTEAADRYFASTHVSRPPAAGFVWKPAEAEAERG